MMTIIIVKNSNNQAIAMSTINSLRYYVYDQGRKGKNRQQLLPRERVIHYLP